MPKSKYITQTPQDFGEALKVSGFSIKNEITDYPNQEPFAFDGSLAVFSGGSGIPLGVNVASGEFFQSRPIINWNLVNPYDGSVFTEENINLLQVFNGFDISLHDETGMLIQNLASGYKDTSFEISTLDIIESFRNVGSEDYRRFRFQVVSNDYYGRKYTGVYFLNSPPPNVTGGQIDIDQNVFIDPFVSKSSGVNSICYYASTISGFDIDVTGSGQNVYQVEYNKVILGQNEGFQREISPLDRRSGFYYAAVAKDNFGTGSAYYFPSSVAPYTIDPLKYNVISSGFRGKIVAERDNFNKQIKTKFVGTTQREFAAEKTRYEVYVEESGIARKNSTLYIGTPNINGFKAIVQGTGGQQLNITSLTSGNPFYAQDFYYSGSNSEPVFSPYDTTGIQWADHTLIVDESKLVENGFSQNTSSIRDIAIPSGYTYSSEIYIDLNFNENLNQFLLYPTGGLHPSGFYTGTYADNPTGGVVTYRKDPTSNYSVSGYAPNIDSQTGVLVASNLSGFILSEYEPRFIYDIDESSSYSFRIRLNMEEDGKSLFSDPLYVSSGAIVSAISGAGYSTGLFNGDTNSGLAFYNADLDILNISDNLFSSGSGFGINVSTPEHHFHVSGDAQISGYLYDSQNTTGEAGYVLASEEGGPQWKQIEDVLSGVGGSGATNYVARWADEDTLTTGVLYDNNTNVGIGTASPAKKLHVTGDTLLESTNSGTASSLSSSATTYGLKVRGAASSGSLNFSSSNARYTLQALSTGNSAISLTLNPFGGNVGIGTVSPDTRLQIVGSTSGDSVLKVDGTNGTLFEVVDDLSDSLMSVNDAAGLPVLEVFADNHIVAGRYNQNDFYLDTNGNLGLGTSSPITKLNIKGDQSANGQLYIEPTNDSEYAGLVIKTTRGADRAYAIFAGGTGTDDLNFRFRDASAGADRVVIDSSGNVGIGTVIPAAKLDVVGDACINSVRVGRGRCNVSNNTAVGLNALNYATGACNTGLGYQALINTTTGCRNTAVGFNSLLSNSTGYVNTAVGTQSMLCNTIGFANAALGNSTLFSNISGSCNTAIGFQSLYYNESGCLNVAVGYNSLLSNTTGSCNTAVGVSSLNNNTTGTNNTAQGYQSLCYNTTGVNNTAQGSRSLFSNTTGGQNTAHGYRSLYSNTTGSYNVAVGMHSLYLNTTGGQNTAVGYSSLNFNTTGSRNTTQGYQSLENNTTGSCNTAQGFWSLNSNTTGTNNTASGYVSLACNTTGCNNTAVGFCSQYTVVTADNNTSFGSSTLKNNTGCSNTAVGAFSLCNNTTGACNIAVGWKSLLNNTSACHNLAIGTCALFHTTTGIRNIGIGHAALKWNITGSHNTGVGFGALVFNTGTGNTAHGACTLYLNTTGADNTAVGLQSLFQNTTGSYNTALGSYSLFTNTTGCYNTSSGSFSLRYNTIGCCNTAFGYSSLFCNTEGSQNTALGMCSLRSNTTGHQNTATGFCSLYTNTTGVYNTAQGSRSLFCNTTGEGNTAVGTESLLSNTTGCYNTAVGYRALRYNTTGRNTAIGTDALYCTTTGIGNVAVGDNSMVCNTTGSHNTASGNCSLLCNTTGCCNTAHGYNSLFCNTTGSYNTAIGRGAGCNITTGSCNIFIGAFTEGGSVSDTNAIAIGYNVNTCGSNTINIGNTSNTKTIFECGYVGIGTTDPTSLLHIDTAANSAANFKLGADRTAANAAIGQIIGVWDGTTVAKIALKTGDDTTNKDDGEIAFEVAAAGSTAEAMRIDSSGNVGIGTISPTGGKLQVAGKVRIDAGSGNDALNLNAYDLLKWDNANHIHFGGYKSGQWAVLKFYSSATERLNIGSDVNVQGATDLNICGTSRRLSFTSGTGTIRTTTSNNLILQTNSTSAITIYPTQQIQFNAYGSGTFTGTATQRLAVDSSGNVIEIPIGSGAVDGSGAANKVTYWTDTDTISYNNNFHWDNTNGNLGIGTSVPSSTLHVSDSTSGSSVLKVDGTSGTIFEVTDDLSSSLMSVNTIAGLPVFEVFADNHIVAGRYNQNDFYLDTNGNLGLGTNAPSKKLEVVNSTAAQILAKGWGPDSAGNDGGAIQLGEESAFHGLFSYDNATSILYIDNAYNSSSGDIRFRTKTSGTAITAVTIEGDGNVGIGAVNPVNNLTVAGDIGYTGYLGQGSIYGNTANASYARVQLYDPATGYTTFNNISYGYYFQTANSTKVTILNNGNVGIGTTAPAQQLEITKNFRLPNSTATTGIIYKDTSRFIHNFSHPSGSTAIPTGRNTFVGANAGNLTIGSTATSTNHGSFNNGVGFQALISLTTGYSNDAFGHRAGLNLTSGFDNALFGYQSGYDLTTGIRNTFLGSNAGQNIATTSYNIAVGYSALLSDNSGVGNTVIGSLAADATIGSDYLVTIGYQSLSNITSGSYNVALGYRAGLNNTVAGNLLNAEYGVFIGPNTNPTEGSTNEIVIGNGADGNGSNTATLGNDSITKTILKGNVGIGTTSPDSKLHIDSTGEPLRFTRTGQETYRLIHGVSGLYFSRPDSGGLSFGVSQNDTFDIFDTSGTVMFRADSSSGNVGIGTANPSEKLDVVGNVKHEGLTMTSGTDVDQLKTFTQTLTITTSWQDTGIDGSDLTTGTYIVQLLGDDDEVGGTYSVYYSGMMSWYSSGTNDTDFTSEIALHRAGHADVGRTLYLRTVTNASGGNDLELQIAGNYNATGSDSYVFKFRRMI